MKKYIVYILIAAMTIPWMLGAYSEYPQDQWYMVRSAVATADTDLNVSTPTTTWSYFGANLMAKAYRVPISAKNLSFEIIGKDNDTTSTVVIWAYHQGGDAEAVCSYTTLSGTMKTGDSTAQYYAGTLTQVYDYWNKTCWTSNDTSGTGIAKINMNTCGAKYFLVLFTAIKSSDTVTCKVTYW
jgi:hypothetical protein